MHVMQEAPYLERRASVGGIIRIFKVGKPGLFVALGLQQAHTLPTAHPIMSCLEHKLAQSLKSTSMTSIPAHLILLCMMYKVGIFLMSFYSYHHIWCPQNLGPVPPG